MNMDNMIRGYRPLNLIPDHAYDRFEDADIITKTCECCNGSGKIYYSCCGVEVESDTTICPECGDEFTPDPEKCNECDGMGEG